jgi:glycosyltransferase involved in cell wall biosynthesis
MRPLAIVTTNRSKYSETFIQNHISHLPGPILVLSGGYLPQYYSVGRRDASVRFRKGQGVLDKFRSSSRREEELVKSISQTLRSYQVKAVLAEYGPSGVEMMPICQSIGIPLVVHFHGYDAYRVDVLSSYGKRYREMFQQVMAVIAVSKHMFDQLLCLGCPREKLHYLPYGIDNQIFYNQKKKRKPQLVCCGRFVEKKGQLFTIRAFKKIAEKYAELQLILIGDGPLRSPCELLVQELGLEARVIFTGILRQEEIATFFNESIVYVQHSIRPSDSDMEGTPLAILEAGACGLPVVATRHTGINDVIKEGETGFLVDEEDIDSMSQSLRVLVENPDLALNMGEKNAREISENYSLDRYTMRLWNIINDSLTALNG